MRTLLAACGSAIVATGVVAMGLGLVSPAQAADDGYANVFSSLLSVTGLIKADPPPEIEYRERAPLVLPPQTTLPPPVPPGAKRTAAWPQDPDVVRRRKEAEEARAPRTLSDKEELLTKAEAERGRVQNKPFATNSCGAKGNARGCLVVSPEELRAESEHYEAVNPETKEVLAAGQEPDRDYLTQPPKGYLKVTKAVKATTEAPQPRVSESDPRAYLRARAKSDDE